MTHGSSETVRANLKEFYEKRLIDTTLKNLTVCVATRSIEVSKAFTPVLPAMAPTNTRCFRKSVAITPSSGLS
jgi:hypothetical protein